MATNLKYSVWRRWFWRLRLTVGKMIVTYAEPARQVDLIEKRAALKHARSPGSRLSAQEINALEVWMLDGQDRDLRREYFRTTPVDRTFQGLMIPLVEAVLERDRTVRTVLNVGVNYAHVDGLMARNHPDIQFIAIDFARNLAEYNQEFCTANLKFVSDYALDRLEDGSLAAELICFSSCAYEIKNNELRRYLKAARDRGYVIFNEPLYLLPGGAPIDPRDVSSDESKAVYSHIGPAGEYGPLAMVHNYRKILEEEGFTVLHYRVFRPTFTDLRMVHVIAKKMSAALADGCSVVCTSEGNLSTAASSTN